MTCPTCGYDPLIAFVENPQDRRFLAHMAHLEAENARLTAERDRLRAALEALLNEHPEVISKWGWVYHAAREALAQMERRDDGCDKAWCAEHGHFSSEALAQSEER